MPSASDITNKVFGSLTALYAEGKPRVWVCLCTCGNTTKVPAQRLNSGSTKSCGCLKKSVLGNTTRTHGRANSRISGYVDKTYGVWQAMRARCKNKNRLDYHRYGGRGITVCKRWDSFQNFVADMGEVPEGKTLDRINNDGNYEPDNCQWATRKEQVYNSTKVKMISINNVAKPLSEWLEYYSLSKSTYYVRLKTGMTPEEALKP